MSRVWEQEDENRSQYHEWRMTCRAGYVQDIDQLEYVITRDGPRPVAIIELCHSKKPVGSPEAYGNTIQEKRESQLAISVMVGKALKVPVYYVICEPDLTRLIIKRLHPLEPDWSVMTKEEWRSELIRLRKEVMLL